MPTVRLFVDLQDATSRTAWLRYRAAVKAAGTPVRMVAHPMPLGRNPRARSAAAAALAARQMGHGNAFVDALLQRDSLTDADFRAAARGSGLAVADFDKRRSAPATVSSVERERSAAIALGVRATPSALLMGRGVSGLPPTVTLRAALAHALRRWRTCNKAANSDCEGAKVGAAGSASRAAFDVLRGRVSKNNKTAASTAGSTIARVVPGRLGERWRVALPKSPLSLGDNANVTVVWYVDPSQPRCCSGGRSLLARAQADEVRLVVIPVANGPDFAPASALHGMKTTEEQRAHVVRQLLKHGGGPLTALAKLLGLRGLARAAAAPQAAVELAAAAALAAKVAAAPGSLFINGRRWLGPVGGPSFAAAISAARSEARSLAGVSTTARYAHLIAHGRVRSAVEADLEPAEELSGLDALADLGSTGAATPKAVDAWLFVDFRRMGSRAAFFALKFLQSHGAPPVRLHLASLTSTREPGVSPAGAALLIAARHGKALACATRLFGASDPDDWRQLRRIFKKIGLKPRLLAKQSRSPGVRAAMAKIARLKREHDMLQAPVLYLGSRRYVGPIDENRIAAAVKFIARHKEAPQ
ncbi:MAG: hypothetical protein KC502_01005 [Myxococcales bacterium]|nr:hypothetical protein [Myxococcales bacterium]